MKKLFVFLTAFTMTVSALGTIALADTDDTASVSNSEPAVTEIADSDSTDVETANPDAVTVLINGIELETDVPAQIIGDRTMVPMRAIFETLGAQVSWIPENQAIFATKGASLIVMKIGVNTLAMSTIGGENKNVELDVPPQIVGERTLVPVRAVSEALGCNVGWDGDTRTVIITK